MEQQRPAAGRGGLAAVLKDDDARRMPRFGAMLCDLVKINSVECVEPDPDEVRALLAKLTEAEAGHAAAAVLNDPLLGTDDRGRPPEPEVMASVGAVFGAVKRRANHQTHADHQPFRGSIAESG